MSSRRRIKHVASHVVGTSTSTDQERPELVPSPSLRQPFLSSEWADAHIRWLAQKDALSQDIYLTGAHGPLRRWLALRYCAVAQREVEYVALTHDTTESDLKQRREFIAGGTIRFVDQPVVSAALHGRVLILEGLEKVERNVLPVLNNLLENREMALEDGRFLCAPDRFDALARDGSSAVTGAGRRLLRVHPRFRVIAIGVPVPPFAGNPLDPPLRHSCPTASLNSPPSATAL